MYGLIKIPVLTDRYILFIVVPILILISAGIYNLNNKTAKNIIIILIVLSTFFDTIFRIHKNEINKPEFKKAIQYISQSSTNIILINNEQNYKIIKNYLENLNNNLIIIEKFDGKEQQLWKLCYLPSTGFACNTQTDEKKLQKIETKNFNLVTINLYKNM